MSGAAAEAPDLGMIALTMDALLLVVSAGWKPREFGRRWFRDPAPAGLLAELHALGLDLRVVYRLSDVRKVWVLDVLAQCR